MNEIERLIAAVPRPEPGEKLDQRIHALLAHPPVRSPIRRRKGMLGWLASAACVGLLGFYLGRQSVVAPLPAELVSTAVTAVAPASDSPPKVAPVATKITNVPLDPDKIAKLFVGPVGRERMFGNGPVTVEISTSP
jgi:hypothetical protein